MSFNIIVKNKKSSKISRENKKEWHNERRVKKLSAMGYDVGSIQAMTTAKTGGIDPKHVEKMLKHEVKDNEMDLSGKHI